MNWRCRFSLSREPRPKRNCPLDQSAYVNKITGTFRSATTTNRSPTAAAEYFRYSKYWSSNHLPCLHLPCLFLPCPRRPALVSVNFIPCTYCCFHIVSI